MSSFNLSAYFLANTCITRVFNPRTSPILLNIWLTSPFRVTASSYLLISITSVVVSFFMVETTESFPRLTTVRKFLSTSSRLRSSDSSCKIVLLIFSWLILISFLIFFASSTIFEIRGDSISFRMVDASSTWISFCCPR